MLGESLRGYALRLDHENSVTMFGRRIGSLSSAFAALPDLRVATGRNLDQLCELLYFDKGQNSPKNKLHISVVEIPTAWVCADRKRICPACLKEFGYMHLAWEIQAIRSCAIHGTKLIWHCSGCNKLLKWDRGSLFTCHCGALLCNLRADLVGPNRSSLDQTIRFCLFPEEFEKPSHSAPSQLQLSPLQRGNRFARLAVITLHIAQQVGYAIALMKPFERDEQHADMALRLIGLGRPAIEAALFSALGNQMQYMKPPDRQWLLYRSPNSRLKALCTKFHLDSSALELQFVRQFMLPAWDEAHCKWLVSVDQSLIGYQNPSDRAVIERRRVEGLQKRLPIWGGRGEKRKDRLIVKFAKRLRKLETRHKQTGSRGHTPPSD